MIMRLSKSFSSADDLSLFVHPEVILSPVASRNFGSKLSLSDQITSSNLVFSMYKNMDVFDYSRPN
jgi:hypothetical protein